MDCLKIAGLLLAGGLSLAGTALGQAQTNFWSEGWPQFRGPDQMGARKTARLPLQWGDSKNLAWKTKLPGPGTSSPIVVGDRIFLTCYTGYNLPGGGATNQSELRRHLLCLNRTDGGLVWDQAIAPELPEQEKIRENHGIRRTWPRSPVENGSWLFRFSERCWGWTRTVARRSGAATPVFPGTCAPARWRTKEWCM